MQHLDIVLATRQILPQSPVFLDVLRGAALDTLADFGEVRTSITLVTFGKAAGKAPREVIQPHLDLIDSATIMDMTIGGYPAVVYRNPQSPWASRVAYIVSIEIRCTLLLSNR